MNKGINFKKALIIQLVIIVILVGGIFLNSTVEFTDNDYSPAGITNNQSFETFYMSLYDDIDTMNQTQIAYSLNYPLKLTIDGEERYIQDRKETYDNMYAIISKEVKKAMKEQKLEEVKIQSNGVVVGDGVLLLGPVMEDGKEIYKVLEIKY